MRKKKALLFAAACIAGGALVVMWIFRENEQTPAWTPRQKEDEFSAILDALVVTFPESPLSEEDRQAWLKRWKESEAAAKRLRELGTNVLPRLMKEVHLVGRVEANDRSAALDDTRRIARAFETLGEDARPLLPMLIEELHAGRSIGASMAGIKYIGGTDAGLALVPGLTNSDPVIRNWTMSAISSFQTNREVALAAVPLLLRRLEDESAVSRSLAASVLGSFEASPETVLPALLGLAERDEDMVVRSQAIKAIGRFGTNATSVKMSLQNIAATEQDERVKRISEWAIRNIEVSPEEIQ